MHFVLFSLKIVLLGHSLTQLLGNPSASINIDSFLFRSQDKHLLLPSIDGPLHVKQFESHC